MASSTSAEVPHRAASMTHSVRSPRRIFLQYPNCPAQTPTTLFCPVQPSTHFANFHFQFIFEKKKQLKKKMKTQFE
jgi:hypothetical protein